MFGIRNFFKSSRTRRSSADGRGSGSGAGSGSGSGTGRRRSEVPAIVEILRDAQGKSQVKQNETKPLVEHTNGGLRVRRIDLQSLVFAPLKANYMAPSPTKRTASRCDYSDMADSEFDDLEKLFKSVANAKAPFLERLYGRRPAIVELRNDLGESLFHTAAMHGNLYALDFLLHCEVDINSQADATGNTALHYAVLSTQLNAIDYLVLKGARTDVLNKQHLAPIHLAVERNLINSLKELLKHRSVYIELEFESTPPALHHAAASDNVGAAIVLLEHGADPSRPNINGLSSIHVAAKNGSCACIDAFVMHAEKHGITRQQFMNIRDRDGNVPLHAAVDSGNLESVRACLDAGADIDVQQEDKSTPLHFACVRGELQMVQLMFEKQSSKKLSVIGMQNMNGFTPLHKAALLDHEELVEYLLEEGADPEMMDIAGRTALLLAASNSAENVLKLLLHKNVNVMHKDAEGRNFVHLSVLNRSSCTSSLVNYCENIAVELRKLVNDRDVSGNTPLHYAGGDGLLVAIEQLLAGGADVAARDHNRDTPLHFASRQGRYNTVKRLLDGVQGGYIVNALNCNGCSALLLAAENGHTCVVDLLLERGALFHRNNAGETVLHIAAAKGHTHTIQLLLNVNSHMLNTVTPKGNTALHYAAMEGHVAAVMVLLDQGAEMTLNSEGASFLHAAILADRKEVVLGVLSHVRWQEAMDIESARHPFTIHYLVDQMPEACLALLDRCARPNDKSSLNVDYAIEYDFKYLEPSEGKKESLRDSGVILSPLPTLNRMVQKNRVELLSHPCCRAYLKMKWETSGSKFYAITFGLYAVYLLTLTVFVLRSDPLCHNDLINITLRRCENSGSGQSFKSKKTSPEAVLPADEDCDNTTTSYWCDVGDHLPVVEPICMAILFVSGIITLSQSLVRIFQQKIAYCIDYGNLISIVLCVSTLVLVCPAIFNGTYHINHHYQWNAGAFALFVGWVNLLLFLQRIDLVGIYVVMFLEILQTLVRVGLVFSILFVAFGFTFHILMRVMPRPNVLVHSPPVYTFIGFKTPMMATLKMLLMAVGDGEYSDTFIIPSEDTHEDTLHFTTLTFIILFLFIICIPIVALNLLLGLSLGNIEYVLKTASLKRLSMQVQLHTEFERKIPKRLLNLFVQSPTYVEHPNRTQRGFFRWLGIFFRWCGMSSNSRRSQKPTCKSNIVDEMRLMRSLETDLDKVKERLRNVTVMVEKQTDMLRSVMDKMQIPSGIEEMEDDTLANYLNERTAKSRTRQFKQAAAHLRMRATVIQKWKKQSFDRLMLASRDCKSTSTSASASASAYGADSVAFQYQSEQNHCNQQQSQEDEEAASKRGATRNEASVTIYAPARRAGQTKSKRKNISFSGDSLS